MDGENSKKRPMSEKEDQSSSKFLRQGMDDDSSIKYSSMSKHVEYESDYSESNASSTSTTNGMDPWDIPIDSKTKNLCFMPVDPAGDNHLTKLNAFSQLKKLDKLRCIDIDFTHTIEDHNKQQDQQIAEILNRIFMASAESLEEIILKTPIGYLRTLVFPVMKKVIKLQLLFYWYGTDTTSFTGYLRSGQIFPKGFKFSVLPKLEEVIINLETEGGNPQNYTRFDCWKNNLKSCRIAKSVKTITYNDDCGFSITRLKTSFPKAIWAEGSDLNSTYKTTSEENSEEDSDD